MALTQEVLHEVHCRPGTADEIARRVRALERYRAPGALAPSVDEVQAVLSDLERDGMAAAYASDYPAQGEPVWHPAPPPAAA